MMMMMMMIASQMHKLYLFCSVHYALDVSEIPPNGSKAY